VITAKEWYDPKPDFKNLYQGDVLAAIPFPSLPTFVSAEREEVWGILRPRPNRAQRPIGEVLRNLPNELIGRAAKDVPDAWSSGDEYIISTCRKMHVILVSRSCDIDKHQRKHLLIAPVFQVSNLQEAQRAADKLNYLRNNDIFHWFYLPPVIGSFPESFADLTQMVPLHRSFFNEEVLQKTLCVRLSSQGTFAFQKSLSDYYGMAFGFAAADQCPQTARYSCSSCFSSGKATITSRVVDEGRNFGTCDACGDRTLWLKVPE